jgi:DENN domain-containing protein 11
MIPDSPETVRRVSIDREEVFAGVDKPGQKARKKSTSSHGTFKTALSPYHPAISLPTLIDTFGPLIYPLYKAALLRKRILLVTEAPVELACNFGMFP